MSHLAALSKGHTGPSAGQSWGCIVTCRTQERAQQRPTVHKFLSFYLSLGPSVRLPFFGDLVSAASELGIPSRGAGYDSNGTKPWGPYSAPPKPSTVVLYIFLYILYRNCIPIILVLRR